jgi:hypothetical protein
VLGRDCAVRGRVRDVARDCPVQGREVLPEWEYMTGLVLKLWVMIDGDCHGVGVRIGMNL